MKASIRCDGEGKPTKLEAHPLVRPEFKIGKASDATHYRKNSDITYMIASLRI